MVFISSIQSISTNQNKSNQGSSMINQPVLYVHGWYKSKFDFFTIQNWLTEDGWNASRLFAYTFRYPADCSDNGIIYNAKQIRGWVNDIINLTGSSKIDIIGHSMGGISSRYYIKFLGGNNTVDDYVSLGTDQHGSPNAQICYTPTDHLIEDLNNGDETPYGLLNNDTLGPQQDIYGVSYNGTHIPGDINYTSIFSRYDDVEPYQSSYLIGAYNIEKSNTTDSSPILHSDLYHTPEIYQLIKNALLDPGQHSIIHTSSNTGQNDLSIDSNAILFSLVVLAIFEIKHKRKH